MDVVVDRNLPLYDRHVPRRAHGGFSEDLRARPFGVNGVGADLRIELVHVASPNIATF